MGQLIFFDERLSNPAGQSCASCHAPEVGFTYPDSDENEEAGPVGGAVAGRFGNRKPPTVAYAGLLPQGPPTFNKQLAAYVGGLFWDGRAANIVAQAGAPFVNPNEMNNVLHNVADPEMVVEQVATGPYADLFEEVYGETVFTESTDQVFLLVCEAIAAYEQSPAVTAFTSKWDAFTSGHTPLSASEQHGLQLFTNSTNGRPGGPPMARGANCVRCHTLGQGPAPGRDLFTNSSYQNTGVPKNPNNPYYTETDSVSNPLGYNPLGANFIDYGLGAFLYPAANLPSGNKGPGSTIQGDFLFVDGTFKTPTLRNVDKRPTADFVKAYGHNGFFKSLKQVVHFYNTRNLTTVPGEVINFTNPSPYAKLRGKPLWPAPEYPSPATLVNPTGRPGDVGNLGLSDQDENDVVNFLTTLSDGFTK